MIRARTLRHFVGGLVKRLLLAVLIVAVVITALSLYVGRTEPEWYEPPPPDDPAVAALADRVEFKLVEETQKIRPDETPWVLRIREHQINAWLGTRLRAWIAHEQGLEWPDQLGTPQVQLLEHAFNLALPVGPPGHQHVAVGRMVPSIENGKLALRLRTLGMGRLVLPGDPMEALADLLGDVSFTERDDSSWQDFLDLLSGQRTIEPVLELSDGRRVEVLEIRCRAGAVELTSRTLRD